jgi:hypothetical protein
VAAKRGGDTCREDQGDCKACIGVGLVAVDHKGGRLSLPGEFRKFSKLAVVGSGVRWCMGRGFCRWVEGGETACKGDVGGNLGGRRVLP